MAAVAVVLAVLASVGHARRLQAIGEREPGDLHMQNHHGASLQLLATLLNGRLPSAAFPGRTSPLGDEPKTNRRSPSNPLAVFVTSLGSFKVELFLSEMPITVSNFIDLAAAGFYDGLSFHRVIPSFMAQFGCPHSRDHESPLAGTGSAEPGTTFKNLETGEFMERSSDGCIPDELIAKISNEPGTLSMANTGQPNSGGSQFFINVVHNSFLDWFDDQTPSQHPVFGRVIQGFDVVEKIVAVPRDQADKPITPVVMESVKIVDE